MSDLLTAFSTIGRCQKILVFGDLMLDRYTWGDAERVSPEAPVIVLRADQEEVRPGGAASVAYLLRHLEAEVSVAGVVGNDSDGHTLRALLRDEGIDDQFVLIDPSRPTTAKHRFVGRASDRHPHQILRVDHESRVPISELLATELWDSLQDRLSHFDAILIADYLKGVCSERLLQQVISKARANGQPVLVDPGRTTDYQRYRGATLLKPNRGEAELACGRSLDSSDHALQAADALRATCELDAVIITLDRDGLVLCAAEDREVIPTDPRTVYDITGAGDMILAALGLCVAGGISTSNAARIANIAAGLEVERFGIAPVKRSEIAVKLSPQSSRSATKLMTVDEVTRLADEYRRQGKRIVFTNGCFDLLHVGHVCYLQGAAALGDILIVAVNSDDSVRRLKGPSRPIIPERDRAQMLASLACVSYVVIFDDPTPCNLLERIRPDVLGKGGTTSEIVGREIVELYGGRVIRLSEVPGISTTSILSSLLDATVDMSHR
jgi:D-beta-D-heptose 7-phosphate kinase/D-beta-D-heptose 1-phosphate adenosyltransferase